MTNAPADTYYERRGSGEPLLLLHGFTGSSQDWIDAGLDWATGFQLIIPDMRGHGRSTPLTGSFRHAEAAADIIALLDRLAIPSCNAIGVSGGGNVLLHIATRQPDRLKAMVIVSATPYFPAQARAIMLQFADSLPAAQRELLRRRHPGGDAQIDALLDASRAFAASYDDMNFTPPLLATIQARTLIVQGDRDPFYPIELSVEMAKAIPNSALSIIPNGGHAPIAGAGWPRFIETALAFLKQ